MDEKTINITLYSKRNYDYEGLVSSNPILIKKEFVVIKTVDENGTIWCAYKVGDGQTAFNDLKWRRIERNQLIRLSDESLWANPSSITSTTNVRDFKEVE